jgi:3-hydroxyphenylacetate 6-hydroxylase
MRLLNAYTIDAHPVSGNSDPTSLVAMSRRYRVRFVPRDGVALRRALEGFRAVEVGWG